MNQKANVARLSRGVTCEGAKKVIGKEVNDFLRISVHHKVVSNFFISVKKGKDDTVD